MDELAGLPGDARKRALDRFRLLQPHVRYNDLWNMQVLQAGSHKLIYLELQPEMIANIARQAGFETRAKDGPRTIQLDLKRPRTAGSLAAVRCRRSGQPGWFSRCQFYVDGRTGGVMQTPLTLANTRPRRATQRNSVRLCIAKELPVSFRLPGKQPSTSRSSITCWSTSWTLSRAPGWPSAAAGGGTVGRPHGKHRPAQLKRRVPLPQEP